MQNKFLSSKALADQCIAAGSLDAFFQDILLHTVQNNPAAEAAEIEKSFFKIAAIILKERYFLFIDEYLQMPDTPVPEVTQSMVDDMDSIDLFFEQYYNLLKARYTAANEGNIEFFKEYHRRDLKQDSMLRAFIIVRNRMLDRRDNKLETGAGIAHFAEGLTGHEDCKAILKTYLTVEGMRKTERELILQNATKLSDGVEIPMAIIESIALESLLATQKDLLKVIKINKPQLRAVPSEYFSQFTWLLG